MIMSIRRAVQLMLVIKIVTLIAAQDPKITISPQPVNSSINEVAEFTCTAVAISFVWEANEVQLDTSEGIFINTIAVNEAMSIRKSTLRMAVSSTDNATNITCIAVSLSPPSIDISDPALLLVQGSLESVNDLIVTVINSTTALISWSPPFTLEGVPILSYDVTITNTTSGAENEKISVAADTTMLYYSIDSNYFTVTVLPINKAGSGESTFSIVHLQIPSSAYIYHSIVAGSPLTPINTTQSSTNNATSLRSVVEVVTIVVSPVIAIALAILLLTAVVFCCLKRKHIKGKETRTDVIMMNNSPAYAVVKRKTLQRLELSENSAYGVVK